MTSVDFRSALLSAALLLGGCASDATFVGPGGIAPNPKQFEADASECRSFWPLVGGFFAGAAYGALQGAAAGASSGGADMGAIVGAGAGGVIGLMIGAVAATSDGYEHCMAGKGYLQAEMPGPPPPAAAAAPVATASRPALPQHRADPDR